MDSESKALLSALDVLHGRAGFSSVGNAPFFFPGLFVDGIGEIAFPLLEQQALAFTRIAEVAPYGKGTKTRHDETVRKCWQLDARHFSFKSPAWRKHLPAKSGYRFCAVYNLVLEEGDPALLNLTAEDHAGPLAALLGKFAKTQDTGTPTVILLQHQYTEANFSIRKLKGNDRQRAAALFAAAEVAGLTARLALATLYQMGELEDGYEYGSHRYRGSRGHDDPDEGTMGEVYEENFNLDHWRDSHDRKLAMGTFPVSLEEVITAEDFSRIDPDEKAGEGYTGNAGCTMEYWYRRAAVVLWPAGCDEEIHCARNLRDACETLLDMSKGKKTGPGSPFEKLAQAAIGVLAASDDPRHHGYGRIDADVRLPVSRIQLALARAKRSDLLEKLVGALAPARLAVCPQTVWRELFTAIEPDAFSAVFKHWLGSPGDFREPLFAVLAALNQQCSKDAWVARIAAKLSRLKPAEIPAWQAAKSRDPVPPGDIKQSRILLHASRELETKDDIAATLRFLKSDASLSAVRTLIGPLFTEEIRSAKSVLSKSVVARELLAFARQALTEELAREIAPYPDWQRPCPPVTEHAPSHHHYGRRDTRPPVLEELAAFMADPAAREHAIRRREDQRVMTEEFIRSHFLDLDCKTIRQGTPHTLLCTKNDHSYRHALQWREKDKQMLRKLEAI